MLPLMLPLVTILVVGLVAGVLLLTSRPFAGSDLAVNLAADLIGSVVLASVLSPVLIAFGKRIEGGLLRREGIPDDFTDFPYEVYLERLRHARAKIRIMDTASGVLDPEDTDESRVRDYRLDCIAELRAAIGRGVKVEILLIDPRSAPALQRSREVQEHGLSIAQELKHNLALLNGIHQDSELPHARSMEVRLYDTSPGIAYCGVDDDAMIAFFMPDRISDESKHLDFSTSSPYGRMTTEYFERVWSKSTSFLDYLYPQVRTNGVGSTRRLACAEYADKVYLSSIWDDALADTLMKLEMGQQLTLILNGDPKLCRVEGRYAHNSDAGELCAQVARTLLEKYGIADYKVFVELGLIGAEA
ncbi:hypothetical protein NSERKGN1266_59140 [Nocardia seriolae]|nr:hypothetical protein NSERKGN1266_59140 [Nocardia seriolae]BEK94203.1 hypothetical protein NSER024013_21090 [Nocardia seriolae]